MEYFFTEKIIGMTLRLSLSGVITFGASKLTLWVSASF
jgi:hypothetical protein